MNNSTCFFCGSSAAVSDTISHITEQIFVKCPVCGRYEYLANFAKPEYKDIVAAYLYHHEKSNNDDLFYYFLGTDNEFKTRENSLNAPVYHATIEEIKAFYPRTFSQKIEKSLLALAQKSEYYGNIINIPDNEMLSLLFIRRFDNCGNPLKQDEIVNQYKSILNYFGNTGYATSVNRPNYTKIQLQAEGWKAIEKLQNTDKYNHDVFVAMSFDPSQNHIWEAINQGVIKAGFSAEIMKDIIHNKEIVPEMFRLIRECRFLIMDISEPNFGAYYEAGYARGLGKEIIITCSKETHDKRYVSNEEDPCAKYKKPHFDIAQKQILVWEDDADLTKQLSEWIKALFR